MHHRQRQGSISSRIDRQIPVSAARCTRHVWIDHHQLCAVAAGLFYERPQMNVGAMNVCAPCDDVPGLPELLRLGAHLAADDSDQSIAAGGGANRAVQLRGAQSIKETVRSE